jgi:hypothetical protein
MELGKPSQTAITAALRRLASVASNGSRPKAQAYTTRVSQPSCDRSARGGWLLPPSAYTQLSEKPASSYTVTGQNVWNGRQETAQRI